MCLSVKKVDFVLQWKSAAVEIRLHDPAAFLLWKLLFVKLQSCK